MNKWLSRDETERIKAVRQRCQVLNNASSKRPGGKKQFLVLSGKLMSHPKTVLFASTGSQHAASVRLHKLPNSLDQAISLTPTSPPPPRAVSVTPFPLRLPPTVCSCLPFNLHSSKTAHHPSQKTSSTGVE